MDGGVLVQLGGRRRFIVAEALAECGLLREILCDFCITGQSARLIRRLPFVGSALYGRLSSRTLPSSITVTTRSVGKACLLEDFAVRRLGGRRHISDPLLIGEKIQRQLSASRYHDCSFIYCYDKAAAVALECASHSGIRGILDQTIAPNDEMDVVLKREASAIGVPYNGWSADTLARIMDEQERAWEFADAIVCGSPFVEQVLRRRGQTGVICPIRPLLRDREFLPWRRARQHDHSRPLRVLTVGQLCVRKGTHVAIEAARRLKKAVEWRFVGHLQEGSESLIRGNPDCAVFRGFRRGGELLDEFSWADVFVLPSLWEGSAYAVTEASYLGLPCIVTFATGAWIRDGVDGYVLEQAEADVLAERLLELFETRELVETMSQAAIESADSYTWENYKRTLANAVCPTLSNTTRSE